MDLLSLKSSRADTGAVLKLKHPSTEEILPGVEITLLGSDSKKYQAMQRARQQQALDRISRGRNANKLNADKLADDTINELASMTVAWAGVELEGVTLECNVENAVKIYTELPWVREQAQEFMAERANFF